MEHFEGFPAQTPRYGFFGQGKITPHTTHLFKQWARLTSNSDGELLGTPLHGFFFAETQLVTRYRHMLNQGSLEGRFSVQVAPNEWLGFGAISHTVCNGEVPHGQPPSGSLELHVRRIVDSGWFERITLRNNDGKNQAFEFDVEFAVPIGDMEYEEEMKLAKGPELKGLKPEVIRHSELLELRYTRNFGKRAHTPTENVREIAGDQAPRDGEAVIRGLVIEVRHDATGACELEVDPGALTRLHFRGTIGPRQDREIELRMEPVIDGERIRIPPAATTPREVYRAPIPASEVGKTRFSTPHSALDLILAQARVDLGSLQLDPFLHGKNPGKYRAFIAGIPRYTGVFGRDILITAWQSAILGSDHLEPALNRVGAYRGRKFDPWRDEEPDRLPHELRLNPDGAIGKTNRYLYYGDVTSTPFWVTTLNGAVAWRGERALLDRQRETLEACLRWIRRRLAEGGGYIWYAPMRPDVRGSNANQAWKDSGDAIVDEAGRVVGPPLAVCEIQGYAYQALSEGADLLERLEAPAREIEHLRREAEDIRVRFNRDFWLEEMGFYALALSTAGKPLRSIASNIGQCLSTGIIDSDRQASVVETLLGPALFSGWGIRTLASDHPAYDPYSYHRGSVWPVENAMIARGLADLGFRTGANRLIAAQLSLATCFGSMRLPEVVSGHARSVEFPIPGVYPFANPLQAWSVSAIFSFVKTMIGARPDAFAQTLYLDPVLPEWLPALEVRDLGVGMASVDLRFSRDEAGTTGVEILNNRGGLRVLSGKPERK
jgi:glycogen debranching enzyme